MRTIATLLVAALAAGCSGEPAAKPGDSGHEAAGPREVRVVLDFPGDDIGGPEQQAALIALRAALERGGVQVVVSSGYGRGTVEVVVEVADDESMRMINEIIRDVHPAGGYRMEPPGR